MKNYSHKYLNTDFNLLYMDKADLVSERRADKSYLNNTRVYYNQVPNLYLFVIHISLMGI